MTLHHAYLIKGWLLDKEPPQAVCEALEALIAAAAVSHGETIRGAPHVAEGRLTMRLGGSETLPPSDESLTRSKDANETETATPAETVPPGPKKHAWSAEQRAAAAERMRARQAAGLMGKRKDAAPSAPPTRPPSEIHRAPKPEQSPASKPMPLPAIDVTRLITVHSGYAGKRDGGQLVDGDWPDIKVRLEKGHARKAIAGDYDTDEESLDFFIESCKRREAKTPPGEGLASPSGRVSDATRRQTW